MKIRSFIFVVLISFLIISSVLVVSRFNAQLVKANPRTIVVPTDYSTIQDAVNHASAVDTIFVKAGTYYENPLINKSLSLIGEDSKNTIIIGESGRGGGQVISIYDNNTKVSGFTLESNPNSSYPIPADGIYIQADRSQITGNNIRNCYSAIFGDSHGSSSIISENNMTANMFTAIRFWFEVENITISGNTIISNPDSSIVLDGSSHIISGNKIENSRWGIGLYRGSNNTVFGNSIKNCSLYAISFYMSSNNTVYGNYIANNTVGIYFSQRDNAMPMNYSKFYHNTLINNGQNALIGVSRSVNFWDNGKEGNYWSDYNGTDKDGDEIGDTSYIIDANNRDRYPLMKAIVIPEFPNMLISPILFMVRAIVVVFSQLKIKRNSVEQ